MFTPKEAITIFCYLAMVDGDFSKDEREKISEIGQAVDQWSFMIYKDEIFSGCEKQTKKVIDEEDYYDVISEGVDKIINNAVTATDGERSISARLLIAILYSRWKIKNSSGVKFATIACVTKPK